MFFYHMDFFENNTKSKSCRFMVTHCSNFDENGVVEKLRSRRVHRHHFYRMRWSYGAPNDAVLFEHNAIKKLKTW